MTAHERTRSSVDDLLRMRLANQGLSTPHAATARDVVARLGAVQAQDFAAARWSVGLRMAGATDADVARAYDAGEILRTHVLRPTWHLVTPDDIRWMLELSAPRVRRAMSSYNRKLHIDGALVKKTNRIIAAALEEESHRTRQELKGRLRSEGVETDTQRLAHIVMEAELDGLICSGPLRGKQLTYALLDERAGPVGPRTRDEALAELCLRYFSAHGPAQITDFAWWSGLTAKDARLALELVAPRLESIEVSGRTHHFLPGESVKPPSALLLSIFDEYTIAYRDRSDFGEGRDVERMLSMGNAQTAVIVLDGRVAGTWKRKLTSRRITVTLAPFRKPSAAHRHALRAQTRRLGAFLGREAAVASVS